MNDTNTQLPKWFKWISNPFLSMVIWPTLIWIIYAIVIKKLYPTTYSIYLSNFWWYPVRIAIPVFFLGSLVLSLSDRLNMNLRSKDINGVLRRVTFEEHFKRHAEFKSVMQKAISVFIFVVGIFAPYMAGWAFFGGVVWFFAKNSI